MVHLDWNRVRTELTKAADGSPIAGTDTSRNRPAVEVMVMAEQEAVATPPDMHRSPTIPGLDHAEVDGTDALLEHIALALADDADLAS